MREGSLVQLIQLLLLLALLLGPLLQRVGRLARREAAAKAEEARRAAGQRPPTVPPQTRLHPDHGKRPIAPAPIGLAPTSKVRKGRASEASRLRSVFAWMAILGPARGSGDDDPTAPPGAC